MPDDPGQAAAHVFQVDLRGAVARLNQLRRMSEERCATAVVEECDWQLEELT